MAFGEFSDADLDDMRTTPKSILNPTARWVTKGGHREKNYQLVAQRDPEECYRIFVRVSASRASVFSVGLARVFPSEKSLVLLRYNGAYHSHRNVIERNVVPPVYHRHIATQRYILAGNDPDGYAEPIERYNSVDTALDCLLRDCGIPSPSSPNQQPLNI